MVIYEQPHHLFEELYHIQLAIEQEQMMYARQEWIDGIRTTKTHTSSEWEFLGKPLNKDRWNQ